LANLLKQLASQAKYPVVAAWCDGLATYDDIATIMTRSMNFNLIKMHLDRWHPAVFVQIYLDTLAAQIHAPDEKMIRFKSENA
jgi:hypothetical protein